MGRIRSIKPEFPQSESVGRLSRDARLLFIMLWTIVDDEGRARAASRMLASTLYPYDDDARDLIDGWLNELESAQCIRRYEADGATYLEIVNWLKHQKIDHPSKSRLPASREKSREPREDSRSLAPDLGPRIKDQDQGSDLRAVADATRAEVAKLFDEFWTEYPKREGANPKTPAIKRFLQAIATGRKHEIDREVAAAIVGGTKRYAAELRRTGKIGTPYVAQAATWLNQRRWQDYPEAAEAPPVLADGQFYAAAESPQLRAWDEHLTRSRGRGCPRDRNGGWVVGSEWPPGYAPLRAGEAASSIA